MIGRIAAAGLLAGLVAAPLAAMAAPDGVVARLAGVYKSRFVNSMADGERYASENVLEIAPYKPGAAYVRLHLEFTNGHVCNLWGVATAGGGRLTYAGPNDLSGNPCTLRIARTADGIHLWETGTEACRLQTCGARGGYRTSADDPPEFPLAARRPIRYLARLRASPQYAEAIQAFDAAGRRP